MRRRRQRLLGSILLFVVLQIIWFGLLGLWIYWFVANHITFTEISERFYPQIDINPQNIISLVGGLVLLVSLTGGISVLFGILRRQLKTTRMYDSFIANVTHELKSPLASIQIHLETMRTRDVTVERRNEFLDLMIRDTARLERLITSILQIAGLEERRSPLNLETNRADELFVPLFRSAASHLNIPEISVDVSGIASCWIRADARAMEIVVDNLVDNAVKYTIGPPNISMKITHARRNIFVTISDDGIGLAPRDQKRVFGKFLRIDRPESPSVKGTGLGLYWVREIVRHHRGKVTVASPGIGMGSSFTVELPIDRSMQSDHRRTRNRA